MFFGGMLIEDFGDFSSVAARKRSVEEILEELSTTSVHSGQGRVIHVLGELRDAIRLSNKDGVPQGFFHEVIQGKIAEVSKTLKLSCAMVPFNRSTRAFELPVAFDGTARTTELFLSAVLHNSRLYDPTKTCPEEESAKESHNNVTKLYKMFGIPTDDMLVICPVWEEDREELVACAIIWAPAPFSDWLYRNWALQSAINAYAEISTVSPTDRPRLELVKDLLEEAKGKERKTIEFERFRWWLHIRLYQWVYRLARFASDPTKAFSQCMDLFGFKTTLYPVSLKSRVTGIKGREHALVIQALNKLLGHQLQKAKDRSIVWNGPVKVENPVCSPEECKALCSYLGLDPDQPYIFLTQASFSKNGKPAFFAFSYKQGTKEEVESGTASDLFYACVLELFDKYWAERAS